VNDKIKARDKVFHSKYGIGTVLTLSTENAAVRFSSIGIIKSVGIKSLRPVENNLKRKDLLSTAILKYPFCGRITQCDDDLAFIEYSGTTDKIYLRDYSQNKIPAMKMLHGKYCIFAIGGHPLKLDVDQSIIEWELLDSWDEKTSQSEFEAKRDKVFSTLTREKTRTILAANWYVKLWEKRSGEKPRFPLKPPPSLDTALDHQLASSRDLDELVELLSAINLSPWYGVNKTKQLEAWSRFFQPSDWSSAIFFSEKKLESLNGYSELLPDCQSMLQTNFAKAKVVAIDLESDGNNIYEFGWKNAFVTKSKKSLMGFSDDELSEAVQQSLLSQKAPCIVGHNLLSWDLQILRKRKTLLPEDSLFWDTFIASFILEPWRKSHALVVKNNAHKADADADACYKLFEEQVSMFGTCLELPVYDLNQLVDKLFKNPSLISQQQKRAYPSSQIYHSTRLVYPVSRINEIKWHRNCHIKWTAEEKILADPALSPRICHDLAVDKDEILAKVISIIVTDASEHGVQVLLSSLPKWLAGDQLQSALKQSHFGQKTEKNHVFHSFYIAEELFKLSQKELESLFKNDAFEISHRNEILAIWQTLNRRILKEQEVREYYQVAVEDRSGRSLLPITQQDGITAWLLYEPSGLEGKGIVWSMLLSPPDWLQADGNIPQNNTDIGDWVTIPRWRDGSARNIDTDRMFVSPDTANRGLYIRDIMHSILNLLKATQKDIFLLVAMHYPTDVSELQKNFIKLSLSTHHPGIPLRKLENAINRKHRVISCREDEISNYIQAAERLKCKIKIVLAEVPLHSWYALLNVPEFVKYNQRIADLSTENTSKKENELSQKKSNVGLPVVLKDSDIYQATTSFLLDWSRSLVGNESLDLPIIVMDSRLINLQKSKFGRLPQFDVSFFSLEELLDNDKQQIFNQVCHPTLNKKEIPTDYEVYRSFLKENWGFDDFRPRSQKPAIEKLIQTNRDILLRLPTGEGKSIIFHLPALLHAQYSHRLTIVITPLRALMRDQAEGLWEKHFTQSVDYLSGGRDAWINHEVYQGILDGRIKLLFVAPERFRVSQFVEVLERRRRNDGGLEFIVFDEAHCISEWGFEFRPDYLYAAQFIAEWFKKKQLPGNPTRLLLTSATVTQRNRIDIERELELGKANRYEELPKDMPHPIQPYIMLDSFDLEDGDLGEDQKFDKIIEILSEINLQESAALVFVRRRKDCHKISESLNAYAASSDSSLASLYALPFHAGLPEVVKAETSDLLKECRVNVLVCTKAFGMGMDIPHLHACIHHRPPSFIEDYLQEVGRIGRDEGERKRSGHEQVTATLLYNQENIERNLTLLHDKSVTPPDLQDFFAFCLKKAVSFEIVEKSIRIIPTKVDFGESKKFDEGQVTNCLFWLERMKALRIEGRLPPFLDISLDRRILGVYAKGNGLASKIADALLRTVEVSLNEISNVDKGSHTEVRSEISFGRIIKGLLKGVFALVTPSKEVKVEHSAPITDLNLPAAKEDQKLDVSISMSELMTASGGISMDDLFSGLLELRNADAVSVHKSFTVQRSTVQSTEQFWALLRKALERLLLKTTGKVELLSKKQFEMELRDWYSRFLDEPSRIDNSDKEASNASKQKVRQLDREIYRAIGTSLRVLRYSGIDIDESLSEDGTILYRRYIPDPRHSFTTRCVHEYISAMHKLRDFISEHEGQSSESQVDAFEILLTDIMDAMGEGILLRKLRELIKLLESAGFYGFEGSLNDWLTLITLNTKKPLESHVPESAGISTTQKIYTEMLEKYELQVLRVKAMALLAVMPSEGRKRFIDRYFDCINVEALTELLEDTVGDIDDEILARTPELQELLSQVRQERFSVEVERLNETQLDICKSSFDGTLLVNAGPGSGKTHVLMMRCAHLIHVQRINPSEILVLAFNRAVVSEIKDRIRDLFHALGYGSYTNRLDVSTFHSFALRYHQASDRYDEEAIGQAVHSFAKSMRANEDFAQRVAGRYKAILVDEFQDMDEDFYTVVENLLKYSRGGGMVIGDDDQDILTWNRRKFNRKYNGNFPLEAIYYFKKFQNTYKPEIYTLNINYRSTPEVVDQANAMLKKLAQDVGFTRMKSDLSLIADRSNQSPRPKTLLTPDSYIDIATQSLSCNENVAILCRSNRECYEFYDRLVDSNNIPYDQIQLLGAEDFPLYQLRHSGAILDACFKHKDYDFAGTDVWEELLNEYEQKGFADLQRDREYLNILYTLVKKEVGRPRIRDIQSFIRETRTSDIERLTARVNPSNGKPKITIATVHKVKGLEYDTVLVMPSSENFPFVSSRNFDSSYAAEEARLCYVALTRARNYLRISWGNRERSWASSSKYTSEYQELHRERLKGSPAEVFVSWGGQSAHVKRGLQDYIEKNVCIGDDIILRGRNLEHNQRVIGLVSKRSSGKLKKSDKLRVSNVIRYICGRHLRESKPEFWEILDIDIRKQGWFYLVLVEEY